MDRLYRYARIPLGLGSAVWLPWSHPDRARLAELRRRDLIHCLGYYEQSTGRLLNCEWTAERVLRLNIEAWSLVDLHAYVRQSHSVVLQENTREGIAMIYARPELFAGEKAIGEKALLVKTIVDFELHQGYVGREADMPLYRYDDTAEEQGGPCAAAADLAPDQSYAKRREWRMAYKRPRRARAGS